MPSISTATAMPISGTRCRTRLRPPPSNCWTRAGSAACAGPMRCIRRPMSIAPSACRKTRCRSAMAQARLRAGLWPTLSAAERAASRRRCCSRPAFTGRHFSPPKTTSSSRNTISPISTCCSSAISATACRSAATAVRDALGQGRATADRAISTACSEILTARGFYHDKIDGKAGMKTRAALGDYQKHNGFKVDCWPTAALLAHMEKTQVR